MKVKNITLSLLLTVSCSLVLPYSLCGLSDGDTKNTRNPSQKPQGLGSPEVHKLTENVYAITGLYHSAGKGFGTNAGMIFTQKSIIFIDAGMSIASAEFLWQIAQKRIEEKENLYLILTHHHGDHTFGMRIMKEQGAKVFAHKIIKHWFEMYSGDQYKRFLTERSGWSPEEGDRIFGDVIFFEPDVVIEQDTILNIDNEEIHLLVTPGHVQDELSVYHPLSKTLFAGDTIYEGSDLTTRFGGPNEWKIWISQLDRLKQLDINTIIPGHGKLCSKKEIDRNINYLKGLFK